MLDLLSGQMLLLFLPVDRLTSLPFSFETGYRHLRCTTLLMFVHLEFSDC